MKEIGIYDFEGIDADMEMMDQVDREMGEVL